MLYKRNTVRMTFIQYAAMLILHSIYAYVVYGFKTGNKVVACSAVCFLFAVLVYCFVKKEAVRVICLFLSVLLATWYIGTVIDTMSYAFVIFLATGLLVATFVDYKRTIWYLLCSDVVLLASAALQWDSYGSDADIFIYLIIFFCYNMANYTLCSLVYFLEKRMEMLEEKTKEAVGASESKGNFLANMSHEIRTPMNAISGLNQLILQEDITDDVREKAFGIQTACSDLLTIVNDILDFSKIESGKMEIVEAEYEIKDMIKDVVNLIYLRTEEHKVEMMVDCDENLPKRLYGDEVRIKQIIMNLLTNAVKFTQEGYVKLSVSWEDAGEDGYLQIAVKDTGIGIKQNSLNRLFDSFEQLDTKRNRKVEGTGLGLAISKQLALLMRGNIAVESEYGKGSVFSVTIPQHKVSPEKFVTIEKENKSMLIYTFSDVFQETMEDMFDDLNIPLIYTTSFRVVEEHTAENSITHYFVADSCYNRHKEFFGALANKHEVIIMQDRSSNLQVQDGIKTLYRPFYIVPLEAVLSGQQSYGVFSKEDIWDFEYIAPNAHILVVDDNDVNLKVTVGLMRPLNMHIVTANSGRKAIELLQKESFDLVFMDHMMPEMDGIETTKLIREMSKEKWDYYDTVPIIALTANAIGGAKEMFLENGFQDFLAKPIELRDFDRILRKWLPPECIQEKVIVRQSSKKETKEGIWLQNADLAEVKEAPKTVLWPTKIEGIDIEVAKHFFGNDAELFLEVAGSFYNSGVHKIEELIRAYREKDWSTYAIETHALKSASKSIGAVVFAEEALELELAAKNGDEQTIQRKHKALLQHFRNLLNQLLPYVTLEEDEDNKPLMRMKQLREKIGEIKALLKEMEESLESQGEMGKNRDSRQWEAMTRKAGELVTYRYSREALKELICRLKEASEEHNLEEISGICAQIEKQHL